MKSRPVFAPPLLRLDRVTVSFDTVSVLDGLDVEVRDGEFVALVGPSGCGKTTLLNVCSGWLAPSAGTVDRPARLRANDARRGKRECRSTCRHDEMAA